MWHRSKMHSIEIGLERAGSLHYYYFLYVEIRYKTP